MSTSDNGFIFCEASFDDVVLAVAHFKSQATGTDIIPHGVIAKSLPSIGHYLVRIFNESLKCGSFPTIWKTSLLITLKKLQFLPHHRTSDQSPYAVSFLKC